MNNPADFSRARVAVPPAAALTAEPAVSIVVNFFNPKGDPRIRAMTELVLQSYRAYTTIPHVLFLVDGHAEPDPRVAAVCDEMGYRYVHLGRRLTFAEGYNAGLRLTTTPWVITSANDIFVVSGWLEALLDAAEKTGAWMTAPYLSTSDYPGQQYSHVIARRRYAPNFLTLNLNLFSRHCLDQVGLLDERFHGCFNDVDYALRIRAAGGEVTLTDCGEITHLGSATLTRAGVAVMYAHDAPLFEEKWPGRWNGDAFRLRAQGGWLRFFFALDRWLPSEWQRRYRRHIYRLEPLLGPRCHLQK